MGSIAFFVSISALGAYFSFAMFAPEAPLWVVAPVFASLLFVIFFGWWLTKEITEPLGKILLSAQILERGGGNSPLQTSGAKETDEILDALQKHSSHLQKMISAMEQVARGNFSLSVKPGSPTDRFGLAFHRMLEESSASLQSKAEMDTLRALLKSINSDIAAAKYGDLTVAAPVGNDDTAPLAFAYNHLLENLRTIVTQIRADSSDVQNSASEIQKRLKNLSTQNEQLSGDIAGASLSLKQMPRAAQKFSAEVVEMNLELAGLREQARRGLDMSRNSAASLNKLSARIEDLSQRARRVDEIAEEIGKIFKVVDDLSRRTNLISLNGAIRSDSDRQGHNQGQDHTQGRGQSYELILEEINRLSQRAKEAAKEFSTLSKVIQSESKQTKTAMNETLHETASLSRSAQETLESLHQLDQQLSDLSRRNDDLAAAAQNQAADSEGVAQAILSASSDTQRSQLDIETMLSAVQSLNNRLEELTASVSSFKLPVPGYVTEMPMAQSGVYLGESFEHPDTPYLS